MKTHLRLFYALVCIIGAFVVCSAKVSAQSFTFGAAGDFAFGSNFNATVNQAAASNLGFFIALGDLSYRSGAEQSWCNTWTSKGVRMALIAGNHDTTESSGGNINTYVQHCPFGLTTLTGNYGRRYYFDYPQTGTPVARFILITPGVRGNVSSLNTFNQGGEGYNFVSNAIDDARSRGIKWIIVAMHKNYISAMVKSDEVGKPLMDLLFSKKVDLVLQGHEHGYERSKQLSCAVVGSYNASCVVDADNQLVKGAGTIIHVIGTGGQTPRSINTADREYPYFASTNDTALGFGKFTVTPTSMQYTFVRSAGGSFSDSFTITDTGATVGPTPRATPTPRPSTTPRPATPTPRPSVTPRPSATARPTPRPSISPRPTSSPLSTPTSGGQCSQADINRDGFVDVTDYAILVRNFFRTCSAHVGTRPTPHADYLCEPSQQTVLINQPAYFSIHNSATNVTWTATSGSPSAGTGNTFSTTYSTPGDYQVRANQAPFACRVTVLAAATVRPRATPTPRSTPQTGQLDIAICDPSSGNFTLSAHNPFFPLNPGHRNILEADGVEVHVRVLNQTEVVAGVTTRVVEEREIDNGELLEISRNYFAMKPDGTVCFFGEDVDIYTNGQVTDHTGAWRAGGQNRPGIFMPGNPQAGQSFYIEQAPGVAQDFARIVSMGGSFTTPAGTFNNVMYVQETPPSPKRYAHGVGLIYDDGSQLIEYTP